MSALPGRALHVIAIELLAALGPYEAEVAQLLRRWPDDGCFERVWELLELVRVYASSVPETRVQTASVMIAHTDLVRLLCRSDAEHQEGLARAIAQAREDHREAVAALRFRLEWLLNRAAVAAR